MMHTVIDPVAMSRIQQSDSNGMNIFPVFHPPMLMFLSQISYCYVFVFVFYVVKLAILLIPIAKSHFQIVAVFFVNLA